MEGTVLLSEAVASELNDNFIESRLHTDKTKPANLAEEYRDLRDQLTGSVAAPIYVVYDPESETVLGQLAGATTEARFLEFLQQSRARLH